MEHPCVGFPKALPLVTLILRGAKESLYRWFGSLFGLGVEMNNALNIEEHNKWSL